MLYLISALPSLVVLIGFPGTTLALKLAKYAALITLLFFVGAAIAFFGGVVMPWYTVIIALVAAGVVIYGWGTEGGLIKKNWVAYIGILVLAQAAIMFFMLMVYPSQFAGF